MTDERREVMNIHVAVAAAKTMAGCIKDCNVELTYCGKDDAGFNTFYLTHKHDGILTQVPVGCTKDEMYNALGRVLMGMTDHGRINGDLTNPA